MKKFTLTRCCLFHKFIGSTNIVPVNEFLSPLGSAKHTNFPYPFLHVTIFHKEEQQTEIQKIEWKFMVQIDEL